MIEVQSLTQLPHEMACNRFRNFAMAMNVSSKVPTSTILQNKVNPVIGLKPRKKSTHSFFFSNKNNNNKIITFFQFPTSILLWRQYYLRHYQILNMTPLQTKVNVVIDLKSQQQRHIHSPFKQQQQPQNHTFFKVSHKYPPFGILNASISPSRNSTCTKSSPN